MMRSREPFTGVTRCSVFLPRNTFRVPGLTTSCCRSGLSCCKVKIVQSADADPMLSRQQEGDSIDKACKTHEEIDLLEAITAQRKKEAERQRLKFLGLKRPAEDE